MGLENILDDCDDLSDPSCMAKVNNYMEELRSEDEHFIQTLAINTSDEVIYWPQPWYQQSSVLTRRLQESGDENSTPFRKDKITKDEDELIDQNWRKFIAKYNIPDKPICFARYKQREKSSRNLKSPFQRAKHFTTSFLAQGLKRTLPQVYYFFVSKYGCPSKGAYSHMELKIIDVVFNFVPSNATKVLTTVLGRHERGINKRCRICKGYVPVKSKVKWTLKMATTVVNNLIKITERPLKKLRNYNITMDVWVKISKVMNIPYYNIRMFWLRCLHVQLFVKEEVKLKSLRSRIFKFLKNTQYRIWSDIRWNDVVKEFPKGYTSVFLYCTTYVGIKDIPRYHSRPLREAAKIARILLKGKTRNYKLKHLIYENNKLVYEKKEEKMEES